MKKSRSLAWRAINSCWNAGEEELHITGWIDPAENVVFFLTTLYEALNKGESKRPEIFDGAYLTCRYRQEYDVPDMPGFVKKVVMPVFFYFGKLFGKYKKFDQAPTPL